MAEGDINNVSRALGQLEGVTRGLAEQIGNLTNQWLRKDDEATRGRQAMYQKIEDMSSRIGALELKVGDMKPLVEAGHTAALRASGVRYILRALWLALVALVGALGASVLNWLTRPMPPHH